MMKEKHKTHQILYWFDSNEYILSL